MDGNFSFIEKIERLFMGFAVRFTGFGVDFMVQILWRCFYTMMLVLVLGRESLKVRKIKKCFGTARTCVSVHLAFE